MDFNLKNDGPARIWTGVYASRTHKYTKLTHGPMHCMVGEYNEAIVPWTPGPAQYPLLHFWEGGGLIMYLNCFGEAVVVYQANPRAHVLYGWRMIECNDPPCEPLIVELDQINKYIHSWGHVLPWYNE